MSFFSRFFGSNKKEHPSTEVQFQWIEAKDNPWGIRVLDLRPFTQTTLSTSADPQMAANAVSYGGEDGTAFWGQEPKTQKTIACTITVLTDQSLQPGVLFIPQAMEQKWAIYFDGQSLLFIRSWLREVFVAAKTRQKDNELIIESITGEFTENESPAFTKAVLLFLLVSHVNGEVVPAPLPKEYETDFNAVGHWAFSAYGNMAHVGVFVTDYMASSQKPLRSHSLLHIAVARGDIKEIEKQLSGGADINSLAGDGLATLHWAIANDDIRIMETLLSKGANPNVITTEGATPIMNAVQSNKIGHLELLLKNGALVNYADHRGFTALHRAAEMGYENIVRLLLAEGADKTIVAENHTALSLAKARGHQAIVGLLSF